jgi:hypothetical protein
LQKLHLEKPWEILPHSGKTCRVGSVNWGKKDSYL